MTARRGHPNRLLLVLQSTGLGGMETHTVDIAREFTRRGTEVTVVQPEFPMSDDLADRFRAAGVSDVIELATDARHGRVRQLPGLLRYVRIVRTVRPNVVHLHTGGATGGIAVIAATRLVSRASVVITEHDVPHENRPFVDRIGRRLIDRCAHGVIAVSRRNGNIRAERSGAPDSFFAVYNGITVPDVESEQRQADRAGVRSAFGIGEDAVVLGSVVRLAEGKGMDTFLDAYAAAERPAGTHLLLVGDGPLKESLVAQAEALGIGDEITWAGHQREPLRFMHAMDAFCLAVPAGSMSIALLEAMAEGLPCVITFGGPEEAIIPEQTGLTARPSDVTHLAAQFTRLLNDAGLRRTLGEAAAAHVRDRYSASRLADDLVRVYRTPGDGPPYELLARRPIPQPTAATGKDLA